MPDSMPRQTRLTDVDIRWDSSPPANDRDAAERRTAETLLEATVALLPDVADDDAAALIKQLALALCGSLAREQRVGEAYHAAVGLAFQAGQTVARVDARHRTLVASYRELLRTRPAGTV